MNDNWILCCKSDYYQSGTRRGQLKPRHMIREIHCDVADIKCLLDNDEATRRNNEYLCEIVDDLYNKINKWLEDTK